MRAAGILVLVVASGCFYTADVNVPPVAMIDRPAGPYYINSTVQLSAVASYDDDVASLGFDWSCGGCPVASQPVPSTFQVVILDHNPVRVTVVVVDAHGASGTASVDLVVADRAPVVEHVQLPSAPSAEGTFPVGRQIPIAVQARDPDHDMVTLSAQIQPPPGSNPNKTTFTRVDATDWQVTPDAPGHWAIMITAEDGYGGKTVKTEGFEVAADAPPCIAATVPAALPDALYLLATSDGPRRFAVASVQDDLDPWPGSDNLSFRWFLGGVEIAGHDLPDFTLDPADYLPGDTLALRVEVADATPRTLPCGPDQPQCSISGDACLQRVTWTVEVR